MFEHQPPPTGKSSLAKVATILAVTGVISFGLCAVGALAGNGSVSGIAIGFGYLAGACILGLILVGILGLVKITISYFKND